MKSDSEASTDPPRRNWDCWVHSSSPSFILKPEAARKATRQERSPDSSPWLPLDAAYSCVRHKRYKDQTTIKCARCMSGFHVASSSVFPLGFFFFSFLIDRSTITLSAAIEPYNSGPSSIHGRLFRHPPTPGLPCVAYGIRLLNSCRPFSSLFFFAARSRCITSILEKKREKKELPKVSSIVRALESSRARKTLQCPPTSSRTRNRSKDSRMGKAIMVLSW